VWYTSPPAFSDMSCRSRVICVGMLVEPARCDTGNFFLFSVKIYFSLKFLDKFIIKNYIYETYLFK